ncbi:MAG: AAA family ATPase [Verrucomicrobia bacterium]|nr:AAA family ATPase [Verrucomicrobiota bacterium]
MNNETLRLFVAATRQNDGKTTAALGLFAALKKRLGRIGFIKPVGQRFVEVEGKRIDEDSLLIDDTFHPQVPLEDMSPIAVEPDFTRRYIEHANNDALVRRLQHAFDRAAWEKDFVIVEGTGHAGVGSVFDLSNARVASILHSKVILVTGGGIGKPIDEIALNRALFDLEGVEIAGVILNKVMPSKREYIADFARRGFARLGIDLLGVLPDVPMLAEATLAQIATSIDGEFLHGWQRNRRHVRRVVIGAASSGNVVEHFAPGTLLVTPGDREDIILAALSSTCLLPSTAATGEQGGGGGKSGPPLVAGVALCGQHRPHPSILDMIHSSEIPFITSPHESFAVASRIHSMTVKTLPGDTEKISAIQTLVEQYVEIDRLLEKLRS